MWQILYFSRELFYAKELVDANSSFFRYMPALVIFVYGILLYGNVLLRQRRIVIFNSFFAASLLFVFDNKYSFVRGILLSLFALGVAAIELKRSSP